MIIIFEIISLRKEMKREELKREIGETTHPHICAI